MNYKSIVPTNAPKAGNAPDVRLFSNKHNQSSKKLTQAASCLVESPTPVIREAYDNNGFMSAVHAAFAEHLPILIIPDDIWHVFLSQVSLIVNKNPERYRKSFVDHKDKELIEVRNDILVMDAVNGVITTEWQTIFPIFEQKMNEKMKIKMNREFSTTTKTHYTVSQILAMDTMKNYINYKVMTKCGFPEIRIGGTVSDWIMLGEVIQEICGRIFETFGPNFLSFINECQKVLEEKGDPDYWEKLYHYKGAISSGQSDSTTGIVNDLFPVNSRGKRAPGAGSKRDVSSFPQVNGKVPFIWEYLGTTNQCEFEAGLTHAAWDQIAGHLYSKPTWKISRVVENEPEEEEED